MRNSSSALLSGFRSISSMRLFCFLLLFCSSGTFSEAKCKFSAIFNFGDSNSDTGGFWAAFPAERGPFGMTYFKKPAGRGTDGRLVIDFLGMLKDEQFDHNFFQSKFGYHEMFEFHKHCSLMRLDYSFDFTFYLVCVICSVSMNAAQALGLPFLSPYLKSIGADFRQGANFATLASTVLLPNTSLFVTGISPFSLGIQLNQIKDLHAKVLEPNPYGNLPPPNIFSEALYTIDIGQNDFTSNLRAIGIEGFKQYLPQVASQIAWTIKELYDMGGRTFMVFNLAPIGCFPAFLVELPHDSSDLDEFGCMISYNTAVVDYNYLLNHTLHEVLDMLLDASVIYVDTHSVKLELFRHPKDHGLLYGTKACCGHGGGAYNFDPEVFCGNSKVINGSNVTATACEDPQNYVSWDGIHATEAANKLITWAVLSGFYSHPPFPLSEFCDLNPIG